ncbi:MAG TPA: oligosaccharide flippase family protein [Gammaproteobacteria bacterium]|nr:oligosaccharide flippase family protein [Gammaproteobacteria bacterium]
MTTAKLLFRGAGLRAFTLVISIGVSFFLAPYVIHSLGDRWYGVWVLIGTFINFYALLDFGVSGAAQRYLAHAMPRNDPEELNTIIAASLVMFCGFGLLALLATIGIVWFAPLLISNPHDVAVFRETAFIMGTGFALSFPFYIQFGVLTANLRFDYTCYVQLGKVIVRAALFLLFLSRGYGIVALAFISVSVDLLGYCVQQLLVRTLAPWLRLRGRHFAIDKMRELIGFGIYQFVGQIANKMKFELDNVVIASTMGVTAVTHFNIAARLNGYTVSAVNSVVPSPPSVYAGYYSRGEHAQIRDKFIILARIKTILTILGMGAALIFARPFITLWVGPQYLDAFLPLVIIIAGRATASILSPSIGVVYAMAKHKFTAFMNLGEAAANLGLSLLLVHWYGLAGVALGTTIPMVATRLTILPAYLCRIMQLPLSRLIKAVVPLVAVAVMAQLPLVYVITTIDIKTYWQILMWGAGYYGPLLIFFYLVMLTPQERALFSEALPWTGKFIEKRQAA